MSSELVSSETRLTVASNAFEKVLAVVELAKPRILLMILLTAMVGFIAAAGGATVSMLHMLAGVALLGAGVGALNQYFERESDRMMRRTERRPLPSGRVKPRVAMLFGAVTSIAGVGYLLLFANLLTGLLAVLTLVSYVFVYTPLKSRTPMSTVVGAFPGAMPPVIGWVAVTDRLTVEPAVLFAIMFLWQFPHFLAIGWIYKEDYARAGIKMLPVVDPEGKVTGRQMLVNALALIPVSVMPTALGIAGKTYFFVALVLGLFYLYFSYRAAVLKTTRQARRLLQASLVYLPILFLMLLLG
ncbi:MAG: heme o synthase [Acidobacteriota bacterium]|nr:heme o synthase [Blastocatellia bacterium]MDW8411275.1 heme o synthase [Acidobacteriota bacterium]